MARRSRHPPQPDTDIAEAPAPPPVIREVHYSAPDGLTLFERDYGNPLSAWLPVLCLPGLSRSSRDFHELAVFLSTHRHRPRRVVAFDYRGRGRSAWDASADGYNPITEMNDVFAGMGALGISRAVVIGTSRGGIIGMLMGLARPASVAALVLNDIGPEIEAHGLARIKTYIGRTPQPDSWSDAAKLMRHLHGGRFTAWGDADWEEFARLTYRDESGMPVGDYDPKLAETFDGVELDRPVPSLWDEFRALRSIPILVIRGENSDLLSAQTVERMGREHPSVDTATVPGEGHPPMLRSGQLMARISAFITAAEGNGLPAEAIVARAEATFDLDAAEEKTDAI
jgi:pimeloyl-ACP methyl ester carboxylesterase